MRLQLKQYPKVRRFKNTRIMLNGKIMVRNQVKHQKYNCVIQQ